MLYRYGDYILVGIYSDNVINAYSRHRKGNEDSNLPIMTLHERVLSVLGCKVS